MVKNCSVLLLVVGFGAFLASCTNDHIGFCEESTTSLCKTCYECGGNDATSAVLCGLAVEADEAGCRELLLNVCTCNDAGYNPERARSCRDQIDKLTCESLEREGTPDVCHRLF